jgi:hypothetical protein
MFLSSFFVIFFFFCLAFGTILPSTPSTPHSYASFSLPESDSVVAKRALVPGQAPINVTKKI